MPKSPAKKYFRRENRGIFSSCGWPLFCYASMTRHHPFTQPFIHQLRGAPQLSHRAHLFSLRIVHALRESCIAEPYTGRRFKKDLLAGLTVGIIAIPLAMALAIATGVAPQYGLYTAVIAGFVI